MRTRWSYVYSYRVHWVGDGHAEMCGSVDSDNELSELDLHQLVLAYLPGHPDIPDGVHPDNCVITRFDYVSCPPLDIPDVKQDGQASAPDTADKPGQV